MTYWEPRCDKFALPLERNFYVLEYREKRTTNTLDSAFQGCFGYKGYGAGRSQLTGIATVLREANANQVRAAKKLGIHRNTLRRQVHELALDFKTLQVGRRRPALSERIVVERKMPRATR